MTIPYTMISSTCWGRDSADCPGCGGNPVLPCPGPERRYYQGNMRRIHGELWYTVRAHLVEVIDNRGWMDGEDAGLGPGFRWRGALVVLRFELDPPSVNPTHALNPELIDELFRVKPPTSMVLFSLS